MPENDLCLRKVIGNPIKRKCHAGNCVSQCESSVRGGLHWIQGRADMWHWSLTASLPFPVFLLHFFQSPHSDFLSHFEVTGCLNSYYKKVLQFKLTNHNSATFSLNIFQLHNRALKFVHYIMFGTTKLYLFYLVYLPQFFFCPCNLCNPRVMSGWCSNMRHLSKAQGPVEEAEKMWFDF